MKDIIIKVKGDKIQIIRKSSKGLLMEIRVTEDDKGIAITQPRTTFVDFIGGAVQFTGKESEIEYQ